MVNTGATPYRGTAWGRYPGCRSSLFVPLKNHEYRKKLQVLGFIEDYVDKGFGAHVDEPDNGLTIEINTLEELLQFAKDIGHEVIVFPGDQETGQPSIEIGGNNVHKNES